MPRAAIRLVAALALAPLGAAASAQEPAPVTANCRDDAMIVFDASGSMSGTDFNTPFTPRIARVKAALAQVLPSVARLRNLGLIDYGPGPYNRCDNIELQLQPSPDAADRILAVVERLVPAGRTPLTAAVREAVKVLGFPERPAVVVLLTDGEETCGGDPCGLARLLRSRGAHLTVHVIGYRPKDSSEGPGFFQSRCLADETGGVYVSVETTQELVAALHRTLGCPAVSRMDTR